MKFYRYMVLGVAVIMLLTGILKMLDSRVQNDYFKERDQVVHFLTNAQTLQVAAVMEIAIAAYLLFSKSLIKSGLVILWFSVIIIIYKIGRKVVFAFEPCGCLGKLGIWFHLNNNQLETLAKSIIGYFLFVAAICLAYGIRRRNVEET